MRTRRPCEEVVSPFTDEDSARLKDLLSKESEYLLPWAPSIVDGELWSIKDAKEYRDEVITCDSGVYGPGIIEGQIICELRNKIKDLLARMEAAEQVVEECILDEHLKTCPLCEEWRKSAGKP